MPYTISEKDVLYGSLYSVISISKLLCFYSIFYNIFSAFVAGLNVPLPDENPDYSGALNASPNVSAESIVKPCFLTFSSKNVSIYPSYHY